MNPWEKIQDFSSAEMILLQNGWENSLLKIDTNNQENSALSKKEKRVQKNIKCKINALISSQSRHVIVLSHLANQIYDKICIWWLKIIILNKNNRRRNINYEIDWTFKLTKYKRKTLENGGVKFLVFVFFF